MNKRIVKIVITVSTALLLASCVTHRAEWPRNSDSRLYEYLQTVEPSTINVVVEVAAPNKSSNPIYELVRASRPSVIERKKIDAFVRSFRLEGVISQRIAGGAEPVANNQYAQNQPLRVTVNYGLSNDLKLAGLHLRLQAPKTETNAGSVCVDEVDIVKQTRVSMDSGEQYLAGKNVALVNEYANIRQLFIEMAIMARGVIENHINARQPIFRPTSDKSSTLEFIDFIAFDGRSYNHNHAQISGDQVLAYRDKVAVAACNSVHIFVTDAQSKPVISKLAKAERNRLKSTPQKTSLSDLAR